MTNRFQTLEACAEALEQATSLSELKKQLGLVQQFLGLDHHYARFLIQGSDPLTLSDLPEGFPFDPLPVQKSSARRVRPFFWNVTTASPQNRRKDATIFVIPLHIHNLASGWHAWFLAASGFLTPQLAASHYLAGCLFDQLFKLTDSQSVAGLTLSRRQIDCLRLVAKGKSNWVIADILGLKPNTVHKYIEDAKARYGVSTRTELVVRALYNGHLHFHDLM